MKKINVHKETFFVVYMNNHYLILAMKCFSLLNMNNHNSAFVKLTIKTVSSVSKLMPILFMKKLQTKTTHQVNKWLIRWTKNQQPPISFCFNRCFTIIWYIGVPGRSEFLDPKFAIKHTIKKWETPLGFTFRSS